MSTEMEIAESSYQVIFRVVNSHLKVLFESDSHSAAEDFCWKFTGPSELEIKKVWVPKE